MATIVPSSSIDGKAPPAGALPLPVFGGFGAVPPGAMVVVADALAVAVGLGVLVGGVAVGLGVLVGRVAVAVGLGVLVGVGVLVALAVGLAAGVAVVVAVDVGVVPGASGVNDVEAMASWPFESAKTTPPSPYSRRSRHLCPWDSSQPRSERCPGTSMLRWRN